MKHFISSRNHTTGDLPYGFLPANPRCRTRSRRCSTAGPPTASAAEVALLRRIIADDPQQRPTMDVIDELLEALTSNDVTQSVAIDPLADLHCCSTKPVIR